MWSMGLVRAREVWRRKRGSGDPGSSMVWETVRRYRRGRGESNRAADFLRNRERRDRDMVVAWERRKNARKVFDEMPA